MWELARDCALTNVHGLAAILGCLAFVVVLTAHDLHQHVCQV